jgi:RNA polymerase sigma factor (sigma-70 family)
MNDLESLYRAHHDRIFRLAYRVTGNLMDAEDVLQTVFLRLSRRETVDLEPNPASYLNRAAINASLDLLRQRGRSPLIQMDDLTNLSPIRRPPGPARSYERRSGGRSVIWVRRVRRCLSSNILKGTATRRLPS